MWKEVIQAEKNAVNVIGAIARQTLRKEVFSRIRLVSRENHLESEAVRIQTNLFRLMKTSNIRQAFSKWRALNFTATRETMQIKQKELIETKEAQRQEMEMMQQRKMDKAERIIK